MLTVYGLRYLPLTILKHLVFLLLSKVKTQKSFAKRMVILTQRHTLHLYLSNVLLHRAISSDLKLAQTYVQ